MEEPLLKPRPAVEAFFEQFDNELVEHFTDDGTFDHDLVNKLNTYYGTDQYNSALLNFWVENEKLLHKNLGDRENLVRLDVDLMMSVYMFDVFYCLDNDDQKPVMAAYEFVVANADWFRDNRIELYAEGKLFKKVHDTLKEKVYKKQSNMDWILLLKEKKKYYDEPKTVTELKEAIRIVTESPDRGGAIVPSLDPPSAIKRFIDTARPTLEVLVLPFTTVSALLRAFISGSDAAIRRTASFRNFTETEPEIQNFDSGSNEIDLAYYRKRLAYQRERARQRDEKTRLDQLNQRREAARARARQNREALPPPEQFVPEPDDFLFDEENLENDFSGIGKGGSEPEPGQIRQSANATGIQSPGPFRGGYVEWTWPNGTIVTPPGAFDSSAVALSAQELADFNRERAESIRGFMNVVVRLPQNIFGRLLLPVSVVADLVENEFEETGRVEFIPSDSGGSGTVIPIVNLTGSPGINNPFGITANSEAAREQLVRSNQVPDVANNGTIPRLLNQPGSSESGILNLSDSDVDSFARRLLNGRLGGTAVDVDIDTVDLSVDPEELRRQYEADLEFSNVRNANDEGFASDGTSSRRVRFPYSVDATRSSVNPEAFRSLEVGPSGPVPRPLTWSGYNDPAQFNPAYDVIVDGRRIPRYEFENRPPTADEAVREQGAINDAIFRWTGNAVYDVTQGAASVAALPFNLGSAVLGLGTVGDLDSAPEGSQSPSIRRKRAFVDHTQSA